MTTARRANSSSLKQRAIAVARQINKTATRLPFLREIFIVLAFCALTAAMTWPYVTRLRDAVAGPGDPYLVSWIMWWDYHQTFTDPLNLFNANILYPYRYTLAFSEHCYGLTLPFFPLFALGFRPLTVHAVAMFFGFALSGYGAFRLARTLTNSNGAAWVAGVVFAFIPYRFNLMAQLVYLFSPWIPLLFEAFILFVRARTTKRAAWLGFTFFMTGLTTISWLLLAIIPLAVWGAMLLTRYSLWRDRDFWLRSAAALGTASVALTPFLVPYYLVSRLYGFQRRIDDVQAHSAHPINWLVAEGRNRLWRGFGAQFPDAAKFQMFPGLLSPLLAMGELLLNRSDGLNNQTRTSKSAVTKVKVLRVLDATIFFLLVLSIVAVGYDRAPDYYGLFQVVTSELALSLLSVAVIARLCLAYPRFLRRDSFNLVETIRSERRTDTFWLGVILAVVGFMYSIGWNFFFYRILYDFMPGFKSMRAPMRGAVFAYLGLALLAGLGSIRITKLISGRLHPGLIYSVLCGLLLVEFCPVPLYFIRGDIFPDRVTLRLKSTPMRGGIAYLPAGVDYNTRYMLRAADHEKPLITATSGFDPPYLDQIQTMTRAGAISQQLMTVLEAIPASYLVVENELIPLERQPDFAGFLGKAVSSGRLRFINRFDEQHDLYAVVKTEPQTRSEAPLPDNVSAREWSALVETDPVNVLGKYQEWSERLVRLHIASYGTLPRYVDFMRDVTQVGRGVIAGDEDNLIAEKFRHFAETWVNQPAFVAAYRNLSDEDFIARVYANAGVKIDQAAEADALKEKRVTRADVLLKLIDDAEFVAREKNRSLVLLHFFGYLRRNPDDPPDKNMDGFLHWVIEMDKGYAPASLSYAFASSIEHQRILQQTRSNATVEQRGR